MRNQSLRAYINGGIRAAEGFANLAGNRNRQRRAASTQASRTSGS